MLSVPSIGLECRLEQELGCKERMEERPCGGSKRWLLSTPSCGLASLCLCVIQECVTLAQTFGMSPFHMWHPLCFTSYFFPPHTVFLPLYSFLFPPNPFSSFCTPHPQPPSELRSFKFLPLSVSFYRLLIQHEPLQSSILWLVEWRPGGGDFQLPGADIFSFYLR